MPLYLAMIRFLTLFLALFKAKKRIMAKYGGMFPGECLMPAERQARLQQKGCSQVPARRTVDGGRPTGVAAGPWPSVPF